MKRALIRFMFCFIPGLAVGAVITALGNPVGGLIACAALTAFGYDITAPRSDRGEK